MQHFETAGTPRKRTELWMICTSIGAVVMLVCAVINGGIMWGRGYSAGVNDALNNPGQFKQVSHTPEWAKQ